MERRGRGGGVEGAERPTGTRTLLPTHLEDAVHALEAAAGECVAVQHRRGAMLHAHKRHIVKDLYHTALDDGTLRQLETSGLPGGLDLPENQGGDKKGSKSHDPAPSRTLASMKDEHDAGEGW